MKKAVTSISAILLIVFCFACSEPLTTREKGAGIGTFAGAGLGAIIGSATGQCRRRRRHRRGSWVDRRRFDR